MRITHKTQAGFTMIELLMVVVIIGILSVIGLNNFMTSQLKARDSQRKSDLQTISKGLEMFYNDKGYYPGAASGKILGQDWGDTAGLTDPDMVGGALYLAKIPMDPGRYQYYYVTDGSGTYFKLYAKLENDQDRQIYAAGYAATDCGGGEECTFGLSSSNVTPE